MRCEDAAAHLADYLAGTLEPPALHDVEAHVAVCAPCQAEFAGDEAMWHLLSRVPVAAPDSAGLRARLDTEIRRQAPAGPAGGGMRPGRLSQYGRVWMPAAAAVLLATGVAVGRATAPAPPAAPELPDLTALRQELREMRIMVGLSLMQQPSASERLKGVSWSGRIEQPGQEVVTALLDTLMHDPNDNVRLATVDALRRFADRDVVRRGTIESLTRQRSPLVQIAIIDFAVEANDREAADALRRAAEDPELNEAVRARAASALEQLG
jgi:hypothetical protein